MKNGVKRMLIHVPSGPLGIVFLQVLILPREYVWLIFAAITCLLVSMVEVARHTYRFCALLFPHACRMYWVREEQWVRAGWLRNYEVKSITSVTLYAISLAIGYALFENQVFVPALQVLAYGDPAARWFGVNHHRPGSFRLRNGKSWTGYWGFVVVSILGIALTHVLHIWFPLYDNLTFTLYVGQALSVLVAGFVELFAGRFDNLFILPVAAFVMSLFV